MGEISFEVKQEALELVKNTSIEANFDEVRAALTEMIAPYKTMVVRADDIAGAKNDRAKIRKVASGIDAMRKQVKSAYTEPLKLFEDKCKELVGICDEGSNNLDEQIKDFEKREADEKIERLRKFYIESASEEWAEYCPWESLLNQKWSNKGYSDETAQAEILDALNRTRDDLDTIRGLDEQDVPALLLEYKRCRDIGAVIRMETTIKQRREAEAQRKAQELKKRASEAERVLAEHKAERAEISKQIEEVASAEPLKTVDFRVVATERQLQSLKGFLRANGIKYGRVE